MTQEKFKQLVSAALTFGALSIPGFSDWLHAAGGTAEVMTLTGALFVVIHGIYSKMHDKAVTAFASAVVLALLVPAPAMAQTGDYRGGVLATYNLTNLEVGVDRVQGATVEIDVNVPGAPLSVVLHGSSTDPLTFSGVGPRIGHNLGPVEIFGHWLLGSLKVGPMATDGVDSKAGGGINIPIGSGRWLLRVGVDHDGTVSYTTVGVGARF